MVLSDRDIRAAIASGRIGIDPFDPAGVQPASIDIRLDRYFRVFRSSRHAYIDLANPLDDITELIQVAEDEKFILHPGEFVLGSTRERIRLSDDVVSRVEGKSSLGRLGLLIHSTAGFIDPGWDGHITLELSNVNNIPITLYPGMRVGQLSCFPLSSPAERPYGTPELGSSYQGQTGPTPSRYRLDLPRKS
ncbi:MAG TPA: dCTP deaminase [Candidatus Limnocylindria bacterium]|nr:dCTP deaminase [Candidatus Limnocylindria bacterium]